MSNDIIQAQYDQLEQVAARFGQQAEATAPLPSQWLPGVIKNIWSGFWE